MSSSMIFSQIKYAFWQGWLNGILRVYRAGLMRRSARWIAMTVRETGARSRSALCAGGQVGMGTLAGQSNQGAIM